MLGHVEHERLEIWQMRGDPGLRDLHPIVVQAESL
jgi:hypothetical protein